jgi:hypothetical protein
MSIGMAHIADRHFREKESQLRQIAATVESCTKRIGNSEPSSKIAHHDHEATSLDQLPVRANKLVGRLTTANRRRLQQKHTPAANTAEFFRFI